MNLRALVYTAAIATGVTFTITCLHLLPRISQLREERDQVIEFATRDSLRAEIYLNNWQRESAKTRATELNFRNVEDMIHTQELTWIRQFQGVKNNLKNLDAAFRTSAEVNQSFKIKARDTVLFANSDSTTERGSPVDTVHALSFGFHDEYNTIEGIVKGDTLKIDKLRIGVPLEGVVYWQRRKFLGLRIGRKDYFSDISSPNPWVKVKGMDYIKVAKR